MRISDWSSDVCSSDLECVERVAGLGQVGVAHPDRELDIAARHGGEGGAVGGEIARDQREQKRWLGEGIVPLGPVPAILQIARGNQSGSAHVELQSLMSITSPVFSLIKKAHPVCHI